MMKKLIIGILVWLVFPARIALAADYVVNNFHSQIEVNQDTSLTITETIEANFNIAKHGIFRIIPVIYSAHGKTINGRLQVLSINQPYSLSRLNQSVKLQIGDPAKTIRGKQTYVIKYKVNNILQRYPEYDELYWNVTGHEWDTTIAKTTAEVISPYAAITKRQDYNEGELTIAVALDKNNQLIWPTKTEAAIETTTSNWGYPVALLPLLIMFGFWLNKGRDKRYLTDNLYVKGRATKTVSFFEHKFLPSVYSPIDNLTPSEAGTILDQKVDTKDVVAEIVELGRLGFLTIKRTEKKRFLGKETDYILSKQVKDTKKLRSYQKYLLEKIFGSKTEVKLSDLKNKFYQHLEEFRKKVYQYLADEKIFNGNPQRVTTNWGIVFGVSMAIMFMPVMIFASITQNYGPVIIYLGSILPGALMIKVMPARTAWGYSLLRQTEGLKWYLGKGKWREEISEKNLFLKDMLPLAVALGVVNRLAKDMKDLGATPPDYFQGFTTANFANQLNHFSSNSSAAVVSSPSGTKWSGSSSWSGGSGFSGRSSGGGFGGGGGESW